MINLIIDLINTYIFEPLMYALHWMSHTGLIMTLPLIIAICIVALVLTEEPKEEK